MMAEINLDYYLFALSDVVVDAHVHVDVHVHVHVDIHVHGVYS